MEHELPGYIEYITAPAYWLDLVFKSSLSSNHKLVAAVIRASLVYNRAKHRQETLISDYSLSRIIGINQDEVRLIVSELINLGWLYCNDTYTGSKKLYSPTFSVIPLGDPKQ